MPGSLPSFAIPASSAKAFLGLCYEPEVEGAAILARLLRMVQAPEPGHFYQGNASSDLPSSLVVASGIAIEKEAAGASCPMLLLDPRLVGLRLGP